MQLIHDSKEGLVRRGNLFHRVISPSPPSDNFSYPFDISENTFRKTMTLFRRIPSSYINYQIT